MSEIQKETDAMMLMPGSSEIAQNAAQDRFRKSRQYSQTPPPSKGHAGTEKSV